MIVCILLTLASGVANAQVDIAPSEAEVNRPFSETDVVNFKTPPKIYEPETWFHFIGGNISQEGIAADLEAINKAGISGLQWFHGDFGGTWPKVTSPIKALTPQWENMVGFMGKKAKELGLRFTVQTCPGWAMAGGPWIKPADAMRDLVWSRTDVQGGQNVKQKLAVPEPSSEEWRDYRDVCVLAFPTPLGDTGTALEATSVESPENLNWNACLQGKLTEALQLEGGKDHTFTFCLPQGTILRTLRLPNVDGMNRDWVYQPDIRIQLEAMNSKGEMLKIADEKIPSSSWQDAVDYDIACNEVKDAQKYRMTISNRHPLSLAYIHLYSAARKNNWRAEAGWTLIDKEKSQEHTNQDVAAFVKENSVKDLTKFMNAQGNLNWEAPKGTQWTILRIGHVNTGRQNGPAPKEATGWECNKLDPKGAEIQFSNYVGHLFEGPLKSSLAEGMLMDSWECSVQTWTQNMEEEFQKANGYGLRAWMPALLGYVVNNQETTSRFLLDWRRTLQNLYNENFFKKMTDMAHEKGLKVQFETAAGDVVPIDAMEYYKYADVPMCEFWQPITESFVGDLNFKPIKPTASAAHIYGKNRVAAESFTSFALTWDEHWEMLKEVANLNMTEGVTHNVFHTYTHNPQINFLPPGSSFGSGIGTPFLRGQTWWKYMPEFTRYLARTSYLLERGKPVSDFLWYLGDEISHRPDQRAPFPQGFKYDYCNPDVLLHRLSVKDGLLSTPEGVTYKALWIPENERMLPETVEKLALLIREGATVIGNAPTAPATMKDSKRTEKRFRAAVKSIWNVAKKAGVYALGKGKIVTGLTIDEAVKKLDMKADLKVADGDELFWLHRKVEGADWYYVTAPNGKEYHGDISFHTNGEAEVWSAMDGEAYRLDTRRDGEYACAHLDLGHAENCFVIFRHGGTSSAKVKPLPTQGQSIAVSPSWTVCFPHGWGAPDSLKITTLKPWKDLDISEEGKAFSGTATYKTTFEIDRVSPDMNFTLDLGHTDMIADVSINGQKAGVLWCNPYVLNIAPYIKKGVNHLTIDVTSTWYNRLVYDAGQPEAQRKTWTINGPGKDSPLHESGLMGPVVVKY